MSLPKPVRALLWIGSSRKDYLTFPAAVQDSFGFSLFLAQTGQRPPAAKQLKGLKTAVIELVEDFDGDNYRPVYTTRIGTSIYVLHAFKKKSNRGVSTPQMHIELIRKRLRDAELHHVQTREPKS